MPCQIPLKVQVVDAAAQVMALDKVEFKKATEDAVTVPGSLYRQLSSPSTAIPPLTVEALRQLMSEAPEDIVTGARKVEPVYVKTVPIKQNRFGQTIRGKLKVPSALLKVEINQDPNDVGVMLLKVSQILADSA
eukprot:GHVT01066149.1.p1 GENE.GHVT01066149.1~~GHVT01066149.1.p1  ORF type:complete len:134 (-),score=24.55 GHVT01066149.1:383-784(-)